MFLERIVHRVLVRVLAAFVCWLSLQLAAITAASAFSGRLVLESGGVSRSAIVVEHERLKRARRPVVIVLHGGNGNGARIRRNLGLEDMARSSGPVMVYPDAVAGHWSDAPGPAATRDAAFIRDLIAKLVADGVADRHRIFLVGSSTGGMMALRLACEASPSFAGLAIVISALPADLAATCKPSAPLALIMIVGTADTLVPYQGGKANISDSKVEVLSSDATEAVFAKAAGCGPGQTVTAVQDRGPKDGSRAFIEKREGCKVPVERVRIEGGGHSIPGRWAGQRPALPDGHNNDVDSAKLIWDFFRTLGG